MELQAVDGADARDVMRALRAAIHGAGPALGLGMVDPAARDVPAGTAVVVTTSGSTGIPKSVVLSRSALIAGALATAARIGEGSWLLALPASYVAGLQVLVRAIVSDREPALLSGAFTPQAFAAASLMMTSTRHGERVPTFTSLVPAQLQKLLDAAEHDTVVASALRSYEAILVGGQALPAAVLERAQSAGARIVRTYGSTETSGGCVYDGRPLDGVSLRIVDGEVQITGPTLADGYLDDPERTAATFPVDDDGTRWYRTGDAGVLSDGVLQVRGRLDNVIVSGGINVSLDRVEQIVRGIPGFAGAVVVGVPDERWGEASVIVCPRGDVLRRSDADHLVSARDAVAAEIGAHARPARLVLVDELSTLPSGKPDREAIRRAVADDAPPPGEAPGRRGLN
ncbi:AMP-binding protein [Microbacterium sp. zg.Y909]|uniref:AMP-binding protein n=1 Tax=Microbacterium sp. zg.Y909 TaxID=2969413 RepID=UPI00214C59A6|nr:AMP-binding protein [Microbacterium sp. zg.Y909]MCR2826005.1 AMP-binding protein [Microbacterium sp. zg.Y909]